MFKKFFLFILTVVTIVSSLFTLFHYFSKEYTYQFRDQIYVDLNAGDVIRHLQNRTRMIKFLPPNFAAPIKKKSSSLYIVYFPILGNCEGYIILEDHDNTEKVREKKVGYKLRTDEVTGEFRFSVLELEVEQKGSKPKTQTRVTLFVKLRGTISIFRTTLRGISPILDTMSETTLDILKRFFAVS